MNNERYSRLSEIQQTKWIIGCPVEITKGALLLDSLSKSVILQLNMRNVGHKKIRQVDLQIFRLDLAGDTIPIFAEPVFHTYEDLDVKVQKTFGDREAINLGKYSTRQVKIVFLKIIFDDITIWRNEDNSDGQELILFSMDSVLGEDNANQFDREYNTKYLKIIDKSSVTDHKFMPQQTADSWICTCGFLNTNDSDFCGRCDVSKDWLFQTVNVDFLSRKFSEYHESEKLRLENIRIQEDEQKRIVLKKAVVDRIRLEKNYKRRIHRTLIIVSIIVVVVTFAIITNVFIIPNNKYNMAHDKMVNKQYSEAIDLFVELGVYRDSKEQVDLVNYTKAQDMFANKQYTEAQALFTELGDYQNSSNQVEKCKIAMIQSAKVEDIIYLGKYEQDNNTSNGKEDIAWRVLAVEKGKILLVSDKILDRQLYNLQEDYEAVTWETCSLRKWLNEIFYKEAFTSEEQTRIAITDVVNNNNPDNETSGGNPTIDKIFLLSIEEANQFFGNDDARIVNSTLYVDAQGEYEYGKDGWWWLRSPGHISCLVVYVDDSGIINSMGGGAMRDYGAVRPAIWLNLPL